MFGPQLGPILVGLCLGTIVSATAGIAEGYTGANMNPTRCLALSVARGSFSCEFSLTLLMPEGELTQLAAGDHWIWWVGPVSRLPFPLAAAGRASLC